MALNSNIQKVLAADGKVIFILANFGGLETLFYRKKNRPKKIGPAVNQKIYDVVRKIFSGEIKADEKKTIIIDKQKLKRISQKFVSQKDRERFNMLADAGIRYLEEGFIELPVYEKQGDKYIRHTRIVRDIEAAVRMQGHILNHYQKNSLKKPGELAHLNNLVRILREANNCLTAWTKVGEKEKKAIESILLTVITELDGCRDEYKQEVIDILADSLELEDTKDRINPGATAAKTIAAIGRLSKRLENLKSIIPAITMRRQVLKLEVEFLKKINELAVIKLKNVENRSWGSLEKHPEDADAMLGQALHHLGRQWPAPYHYRAWLAERYVLDAKKNLRKGHLEQMKREIEASLKYL